MEVLRPSVAGLPGQTGSGLFVYPLKIGHQPYQGYVNTGDLPLLSVLLYPASFYLPLKPVTTILHLLPGISSLPSPAVGRCYRDTMDSGSCVKCVGLPVDVFALVLEQLHKIAPAQLFLLRHVSKDFDALITPIVYRNIILNNKIVSCFRDQSSQITPLQWRVVSKVSLYTQYITIGRSLEWNTTIALFGTLRELKGLQWSYWSDNGRGLNLSGTISLKLLDALQRDWPQYSLSIDCFSLSPGSYHNFENIDFHVTRLVSCKSWSWLLLGQRRLIGDILLRASNLKVLHLLDSPERLSPEGYSFHRHLLVGDGLSSDVRLPAISELFLQDYHWVHTTPASVHFWNWTNVTFLKLEEVDILRFLRSVSPDHLLRLKNFITDGYCKRVDHRIEAMRYINTLLERVDALETLSLVCYIGMLSMGTIRSNPSLQNLKLRYMAI